MAQLGYLSMMLTYGALTLGIANVILLLALLKTYWETYKQVKSGFTIGLLYFSTFLLLQNIVSTVFIVLPFFMTIEFHGSEMSGPRLPLLLINIAQLVALSILLKITKK